jgi:hypothetical protein
VEHLLFPFRISVTTTRKDEYALLPCHIFDRPVHCRGEWIGHIFQEQADGCGPVICPPQCASDSILLIVQEGDGILHCSGALDRDATLPANHTGHCLDADPGKDGNVTNSRRASLLPVH